MISPLSIILVVSIILRLVWINQSLWLDESIEALALMGRMGPIMQYALADYQPPLYHLIGVVFTKIFGYSEMALRLPSLISGVLTVYFITKIGELIGNNKIGLIAGLIAATNPLLIYYSQEGRTYAMTTLFVSASFYYFLQLLTHQSRSRDYKLTLYYLFFTIAFLWTSYLSWFVFLLQAIYVLWKKRYDILLLQIIAGLTLSLWAPSFITSLQIGQSTRGGSPEWGKVVGGLTWKSLPLTWVKFVIGRIGFDNKYLYGMIVAAIGIVHFIPLTRVPYAKHKLLVLWIVLPILLGLLTATILPVYQYFRVLFVLPAYILLVAIGLSRLKTQAQFSVVITLQLIALGYFWITPKYHKEDWRTLASELPYSATIAMPSRAQIAPLRYYDITKEVIEPSHEPIYGDTVYYIRYAEEIFDTQKLGQAKLHNSGYTITSQKSYPGIQLDIYEKTQNSN